MNVMGRVPLDICHLVDSNDNDKEIPGMPPMEDAVLEVL